MITEAIIVYKGLSFLLLLLEIFESIKLQVIVLRIITEATIVYEGLLLLLLLLPIGWNTWKHKTVCKLFVLRIVLLNL